MVGVRLVPGETFDETQVYYIKCNGSGSNWQHRLLNPAYVHKVYKFKREVTHVDLCINDDAEDLIDLQEDVRKYIEANPDVLFRDEPADIYRFQSFVRGDESEIETYIREYLLLDHPVLIKVKVDGARIKTKQNEPSDVKLDLRRLVTGRLTATVWVNREAKTVGVSVRMPTIVDMGMGADELSADRDEDDEDDSNLIADILRAEQARLAENESRKRKRKRDADDDGKYTK